MKSTKKLVFASLCAALCCIGTMIAIPTGITLGYVHIGDAFVLLTGVLLGPLYGFFAGGIGSMLADLLSGYAIYVPGTFLIKGLCSMVAGLLFHRILKHGDSSRIKLMIKMILCGIISESIMVLGYFGYDALLLILTEGSKATLSAAFASSAMGIPYNIGQGVVAIILSIVILPILTKIGDLKNILYHS